MLRSFRRQRCWVEVVWLALAWLVLAACGAPATQPLRFSAAPWQDGERSDYSLTSDGVAVGTATFEVRSGVDGGDGWSFRRETSGAGGQEIVAVEMSESGFRPLTSTLVHMAPDGVEQVAATYEKGEVRLELVTRQNNLTYDTFNIPSDAREQRTLPLIVRTLPLEAGYATSLNTFLPYTGRLERVAVRVEDRETIDTAAGPYETWRVGLESPDRQMTAWVGVDAPFPLVRLEEGDLTFTLERFSPDGN